MSKLKEMALVLGGHFHLGIADLSLHRLGLFGMLLLNLGEHEALPFTSPLMFISNALMISCAGTAPHPRHLR